MVTGRSSPAEDIRRFAADLSELRSRAGLTIRDLSATTDIPAGTLGGYFSGRHLPPANRPEVLDQVLAACRVPEEEREEWADRLRELHLERRSPRVGESPYRGLDPYGPQDADIFFGREEERDRLVEQVLAIEPGDPLPVVCVVGPSGAGKTSLLLAGLAATLAEQDPAWSWSRYDLDATRGEGDQRDTAPLPREPSSPTLVVADQLEPAFVADHPEAAARLAALLDWAEAGRPDQPVRVVALALRADLYPRALQDRRLKQALQDRQLVLSRMGPDDLRAVVEGPARTRGLALDEGLVDLIVTEAGHEPDRALPHLSYLLARMFAVSDHRTLRVTDYLGQGGFTGAIRVAAEEAYDELDPDGRALARDLLLRMVTFQPDAGPVRRRLSTQEPEHVRVLSHFAQRRLLTLTEAGYELSHEALLRGWPRLAEWIEEDRARLTAADRLATAAQEWQEADRDPMLLLRGARLETSRELFDEAPLPPVQADYLHASTEAAGEEQRRERRRLSRARQMVAALAALVLLAVASLVAVQRSREDAVDARAAAESREIASYANHLVSTDLPVSSYLSVAAHQRADNRSTRSAVMAATGLPTLSRYAVGLRPNRLAVWGDGSMGAVGGLGGEVELVRLGQGAPEQVHLRPARVPDEAPEGQDSVDARPPVIIAMAASADGTVLATGDSGRHVDVVDASHPGAPVQTAQIELPEYTVVDDEGTQVVQSVASDLDVTPDGSLLAAALGRGGAAVWRHTGTGTWEQVEVPDPPPGVVMAVRWSRDGSLLAAVTEEGWTYLWRRDGAALEPVTSVQAEGSRLFAVDLAPDASRVAVSGSDRTVYVYRFDGEELELEIALEEFTTWVNDVRFSRDGSLLVAGSSNRLVQAWPVTPERIPAQPAHVVPVPGEVMEVREAADGQWLVIDGSGVLHRWSVVGRRLPDHEAIVFVTRFARDVPVLLTSAGVDDGRVRLWDVADTAAPRPLAEMRAPAGVGVPVGTSDISPDGRWALTGTDAGWTLVWDISDPTVPELVHRVRLGPRYILGGVISEDSSWAVTFSDSGSLSILQLGDEVTSTPPVQMARAPLAVDAGQDAFAVTWADQGVDVFAPEAPTTSLLSWPTRGSAADVRLTEGDTRLSLAGADRRVHMVDISDHAAPEEVQVLTGPGSTINGLDVTPDGSRVAGAVIDGSVWTWERREDGSYEQRLGAILPTQSAMAVGWSPHEDVLAIGGHRGLAGLWVTDPDQAVAEICARNGDRLTDDEWRSALPDLPRQQPCADLPVE